MAEMNLQEYSFAETQMAYMLTTTTLIIVKGDIQHALKRLDSLLTKTSDEVAINVTKLSKEMIGFCDSIIIGKESPPQKFVKLGFHYPPPPKKT